MQKGTGTKRRGINTSLDGQGVYRGAAQVVATRGKAGARVASPSASTSTSQTDAISLQLFSRSTSAKTKEESSRQRWLRIESIAFQQACMCVRVRASNSHLSCLILKSMLHLFVIGEQIYCGVPRFCCVRSKRSALCVREGWKWKWKRAAHGREDLALCRPIGVVSASVLQKQ